MVNFWSLLLPNILLACELKMHWGMLIGSLCRYMETIIAAINQNKVALKLYFTLEVFFKG